jgi:hypothetical protein
MRTLATLVVVMVLPVSACGNGSSAADGSVPGDGEVADAAEVPADAVGGFPALGVYVMNVDGTGLTLLVDPGSRHLSHVRLLAGTDWLTATRYHEDLDQNGLAMELEANAPGGLNYEGAQIVVFQRASPLSITDIVPSVPGKLAANSSWTSDGRLVFLLQDHPSNPSWTQIKRATFAALPTSFTIATVPVPAELVVPLDPHQLGASDASGSLVFPALYQHTSGWMRPVWTIPASGTTTMADVSLVGCPVCPAVSGCCAWPTVDGVLGTNDPRFSHDGTQVMWMHQHPDVSFDLGPIHGYPMRPHKRVLAEPASVDLTPAGVAATTSVSFGEWRPDDAEVVYWTIGIEGTALKQRLFRMAPDGTNRQPIPLPPELCPHHPSYLSSTEIVFSAFRCFGAGCTCAP